MKTLTGLTLEEVKAKMIAVLPAHAYKEVGGSSYLTDINNGFMLETLTECFGMVGYGWFYTYDPEDMIFGTVKRKDGEDPSVTLKALNLFYRYREDDGSLSTSEPIPAPGGSANRKLEDAVKGAVSNALGKAVAALLWQLPVYKGELTHKNVGSYKPGEPAKGGKAPPPPPPPQGQKKQGSPPPPPPPQSEDPQPSQEQEKAQPARGKEQALSPEKVKEVIQIKVNQFGDFEASEKFLKFVRWMLTECFPDAPEPGLQAHSVYRYLFGKDSSKLLTGAEVKALGQWLNAQEVEEDGVKTPRPCGAAVVEAKAIAAAQAEQEKHEPTEE